MYAVVETGGKQYRLSKNDVVDIEKIEAVPGKAVSLDKVLLYVDAKKVEIGKPYLKGASLSCEFVNNVKGTKIYSFKKKRRKGYQKKIGHRQNLVRLKVKEINHGA